MKPGLPKTRKERLTAALAVLAALCAVDGLLLEPNWIEVTHHSLSAHVAQPLKIAHLTDLHTKGLGFRERRLLKLLALEKPDLIVITGDTISSTGTYQQESDMLRQLHAPLGVWLVRGNWENVKTLRGEGEFYRANGVHFLPNRSAAARPDVWLTGINDTTGTSAEVERAIASVPANTFHIALFHSPAFFSESAVQYDLGLAGHSHGGQVRIPFWGPLWLPSGVGPYRDGWFAAGERRMYVSRGIGTSLLPVR
ncbi:MAG TPA: metallophosphoesterase, partial [Candidatus Acidoferrum sp.]|nr:metallophosphoesterase [Candidatus Acidoferrum sp.]